MHKRGQVSKISLLSSAPIVVVFVLLYKADD